MATKPRGRKKKAGAVVRSIRFPGPLYAQLKARADDQGIDVTSALIVVPALTLLRNGNHRHDGTPVA